MLWYGNNSIFKQCYLSPYVPNDENNPRNNHINLDGFGIGMVCSDQPIIYRNTILPWNDINLQKIMSVVKPNILLVHIRAVASFANICKYSCAIKKTPVHEFNCHPFIYKNYIFCHNGIMEAFYDGSLRKIIINRISDDLITNIEGTTDSEYLFYLILTLIYENNSVVAAINKTLQFLNSLSELSPDNLLCLNMCLIDNKEVYGIRYINKDDDIPPSLYVNNDINEIIISSEPVDKAQSWRLIDKNKLIYVDHNNKVVDISLSI